MNAKLVRNARFGLMLAITPFAACLAGCATPGDAGGQDVSANMLTTPYHPVDKYQVQPPPTIHYWAPSGTAAIDAQLMNRMR